jgi:NAD(P)-dependent dehydrogenase (short-subunit alcohol dehydrogenase family)
MTRHHSDPTLERLHSDSGKLTVMGIALVTGTSSGIGRATALELARRGYDVIATMRDTDKSAGLLADAEDGGVTLRIEQLDVNDDESVHAAFARVGPVDILVNNAGMSPVGSVEEFSIDDWKNLFETNVFGVVRCIQAALPLMRARGSGHIVNISSVAGRVAIPMFGPYSASKWAVEAMSESLAAEAAIFGVAVTLVEPGAIVTPIREKTGAPERNSPYRPVAKNWGFSVGYDHARASPAELVATTVADAADATTPPLRVTVGSGIDELIELRSRHDDAAWTDLWSADTGDFLARWTDLTGIDLTEPTT